MRQRKVKNLNEKLEAVSLLRIEKPEECRGSWNEVFGNDNNLFLELGCGKGQFLIGQATANPDCNYIGIEGQDSVVLRALEKAEAAGLTNIRFSGQFVKNLEELFQPEELSGIFLNFSDPWPKVRHAKRRLTHRSYLMQYGKLIKPSGFLEFKTDNDLLFEFTLEEIKNCGIKLAEMTKNLHETQLEARKITTEYEDKFKLAGKNINYLRIEY